MSPGPRANGLGQEDAEGGEAEAAVTVFCGLTAAVDADAVMAVFRKVTERDVRLLQVEGDVDEHDVLFDQM